MTRLKNPVQLAVIGAPHGVRGEVRVRTFTGDPLALGDYGPLFSADGRRFTVTAIRPAKNVVVARFKEIGSREAAEAATGTELFVEREALPDDLEEDEFYQADLIGLAVKDETGAQIGRIAGVQDFGGGDVIEIALAAGRTALIPFTRAAVPRISVAEGYVQIDSPAAGLLEDKDE
jgi:16S rRNA processing protein RimM